ncbi:YcjF family protein [uncultured Thiothrix sp.]|uniref:YcjF family protein n=1 Tax=uncultured Thiothrix sp. TaxID=223185 RepID=UPI0026103C67|nr:GTP-binding protein [uncultured Thiothrix sp.]HMT93134.1 GTP-binding protein [Thiolinea sp.]
MTSEEASAKKNLQGDSHLNLATASLRRLLEDKNLPEDVRNTLKDDYTQVQSMLDKLEHGHIHIAVFGRVSVGKSSLLNALLGKDAFSVSVLHGETKTTDFHAWDEYADSGLYLIDTPGINEIAGEDRERMAHEVATRADLVLFVIDGDLTDVEFRALKTVTASHRPTILVVNKADRYTDKEKQQLRTVLEERTHGILEAENIIFTTAQASRQTVIYVDAEGNEQEGLRVRPVDVQALKTRLWAIIEAEGKTLAALNASLFASNLSEEVGKRILAVKHELGLKTIQMYCIAQGVAVALNPIPVADLVAAAAIDAGMIVHLSKLYGLPMSKSEAGDLLKTISGQMIVLIGTTWAVHLISTVLKLGTGGISTLLTAATQGAVAWYSTLVVGRVAESWLANGKSWGEAGPKFTVEQILDSLDRDSVIAEAREEIMAYIRKTVKN